MHAATPNALPARITRPVADRVIQRNQDDYAEKQFAQEVRAQSLAEIKVYGPHLYFALRVNMRSVTHKPVQSSGRMSGEQR